MVFSLNEGIFGMGWDGLRMSGYGDIWRWDTIFGDLDLDLDVERMLRYIYEARMPSTILSMP